MATPFSLRPLAETVDLEDVRANFELRTAKPRRDAPDLETAKQAVRKQLSEALHEALFPAFDAALREGLQDVYDEHDMRHEERPEGKGNGQAAWDEALSEATEAYLGDDIKRICGEGWIGEMAIGPRLDQQQVRERIASDAARRLASQIAESTTVEAIGLAQDDIEAMARLRLPALRAVPVQPPEGDPDEAVRLLAGHIETLRDLGRIVDEAEMVPELELIGDYDAVLTPGAIRRLGLDELIVPHAVAYRELRGENWAYRLFKEALEPPQEVAAPSHPPEAQSEPAAVPAAPEPKRRGRPLRDAGRPAVRERNASLQRAAFLLSAHGGTAGRDLAAHIGITQSDWSRIINGKLVPEFDLNQIEKLVTSAQSHIAGLEDAIQRLEAAQLK